MKKKDCRRDTEKKQVTPQSNSTFYCSLVNNTQTLRQSQRETGISALKGSAHWPEQLQEPMAVTQSSKAAASDCSLLVRIPKLSQLTQGLSVKGRHISKCCKPCIANQPHYLHISLFCQVFSFLHPTKF